MSKQFNGVLLAAVAVFCVVWFLTPRLAYSRPRYYAQYGLRYFWSYCQVTVDKRPSDCDWSEPPLGSKNCHYVAAAENSYVGKDVVTGESVGMTQNTTFPSTNWHSEHAHFYEPVVHVGWKKEQN